MSNNKIEHVIADDGKVIRRVTSEVILKIDDAILSTLTSGTPVKIRWVNTAKEKFVCDLIIKGPVVIAVANMYSLDLKMPWKLVDGHMVPDILNKEGTRVSMPFKSQGNLHIMVATTCSFIAGSGWQPSMNYLLLRDVTRGVYYLPPLPNLYDDGRVCTGGGGEQGLELKTTLDEINWQSIRVIEDAPWGSHLPKPEEAQAKLFRFEPKNDGFVWRPVGNWQDHCTKVVTELTALIS